jgi:P4 family phage/plasmid primase-like protien
MTDIASEFEERDEAHARHEARKPKGEPPAVIAPDILNFQELEGSSTDKALANQFFIKYRGLFCNGDGQLYMYLSKPGRWVRDDVATHIYSHAMELSAGYYEQLAQVTQMRTDALAAERGEEAERLATRQQQLVKRIQHTEKAATIGNIAKMVHSKVRTVNKAEEVRMNVNPALLACSNGVVDLGTGELRWPRQNDYITRNTGVAYVPEADFSWWHARVMEMCHGNARLAEFLQVWFGYCTTGYTREHCMAVMYGSGRNGKNVLMDAVASALGGYASALTASFLEAQGKESGDSNNVLYMMAQLDGVRMAYVSETGERGKLRESTVKSLTGDKTVRARLAYENFYEFPITHKFTIGTNHKPEITGTDDGIWKRVRLIPMRVRFGTEEEVAADIAQYRQDATLLDAVQDTTRREQVLAWCIEGAAKFIKHGLERYTPPEVTAETQAYRREQDVLGQFLQAVSAHVPKTEIDLTVARIEATPTKMRGKFSDEDMLRVDTMELWRTYAVWSEDNGHYKMSSTMFARRITSAQRFWPGDGDGELLMKSLEMVRTDRGRRYIFFRWNSVGIQLRDHARNKHTMKMHDPDAAERDF